jgi:nucleoside-diphosphate-sugar epimerase
MKILITGATGFIGSWLTRYFLRLKKEIIAHGSSKNSIANLEKKILSDGIKLNNLEYWTQDFLKSTWEFPNFSEIDAIIHCAAATKVREGTIEYYDNYFGLNVIGTKILGKKALEGKIGHFIHFSTGQIFGHPTSFPITESTPKNPINLYGYTKLMSERVIESLGVLGLNYSILRPFSVYGKENDNIISIIINKIINDDEITVYGDGNQTRAFLHVNNICKATDIILNNTASFAQDYNLSGLKEYSVTYLIDLISAKLKKKPKIVYKEGNIMELRRNIADIGKIRNLGFKPEGTLEEFINEYLKN